MFKWVVEEKRDVFKEERFLEEKQFGKCFIKEKWFELGLKGCIIFGKDERVFWV